MGDGLPYALPSLDVVGRCQLGFAGIRCSRAAPIPVREVMPLQSQLVRFQD